MNKYQTLNIITKIQKVLTIISLLLLGMLLFQLLMNSKEQAVQVQPNSISPSTTSCPTQEDPREIRLKAFLETRASRLAVNTTYFVQTADKYGLDWTLIPSISGIESNFGKSMPENSNNPFGIGGRGPARFSSIPEAIEYEGKLLAKY